MFEIILALILISAYAFLMVHFFYTLVAIFRGSAYIPTPHKRVAQMVNIANVQPTDTVLDFGSGDGRIVAAFIAAGAKQCIGIEINPLLVIYSKLRFLLTGKKNAHIYLKNIWKVDLSEVDILTSYMTSCFTEKLEKKIKEEMRPGAKVVSYDFPFPNLTLIKKEENVYLYQVPQINNQI